MKDMYDMMRKITGDQRTDKLDLLIQKVNRLEKMHYSESMRLADTYSLSLLQPLIEGHPFLPFTASSLRPFCLVTILNDIRVNGRNKILEFGSGISSLMIGRLIKSEQLNAKLITIEHNENWSNLLSELLKKEDLEGCVKVVYAPLTECDLSLESNKWYDREAINKEAGEKTFDLMIVDGPPAFNPAEEKSRYPAVPYIFDKLQENCSIYLDDASRSGERFVLQAWEKKFSIKFQLKGGTLAHFTRGKSFFTEPFLFF